MGSRGKRLLEMARLQCLSIPRYESTKSTTPDERKIALRDQELLLQTEGQIAEVNLAGCDSTTTGYDEILTQTSVLTTNSILSYREPADEQFREPVKNILKNQPVVEQDEDSLSEDKTSGSEYLPTDDSSSDAEQSPPFSNKKVNYHVTAEFDSKSLGENSQSKEPEPKRKSALFSNQKSLKSFCIMEADTTTPSISNKRNRKNRGKNCIILEAKKNENGKRIRDKRHACYFCHKEVIHMARHLQLNHGNEPEVAKLLSLPKNSKDRKNAFSEISRIGDFYHNCEILASKKGELILVRRPTPNEVKLLTYSDYGPCPHCLGFMLKKHLWHHIKNNCPRREKEEVSTEGEDKHYRSTIAESNAILSNLFETELSADYKRYILDAFRNDEVGTYCKEDQLIAKFGAMQFEKYGVTQCDLIKQWMRQLSRLTLKLRETSVRNLGLVDFLVPDKFDIVVANVKLLSGSSTNITTKRPEFATPSLALKIGHSLKKCANIERGKALRDNNLQRNKQLLGFINLMEMEWSMRISSNALATLSRKKFNVPQLLPITDDLKKLNNHIDSQIEKAKENLTKNPTTTNWSRLSSLTLSRIILFNKRRAGEASKITVEQYRSRPSWSDQSTHELKNSLTLYEKKLAERFCIVHIIGKRGRKVPVILTDSTKLAIDILLKHRKDCGVSDNNPYIFARFKSNTNIRGHDCLKKVISEVDLQKPNYITGTKLRKYVATVCQVFDLSENEYDWLARHLGHDIRVHREFYRLHEDVVELTKVSRLLLAVDKGEASSFAGKQLSDIELKDLPPVEEDDEERIDQVVGEDEIAGPSHMVSPNRESSKRQKRSTKISKSIDSSERERKGKKLWSDEEKLVVTKYFKLHLKNSIVPKKKDCEDLQQKYPFLLSRKWSDIKFYIVNQIKKAKKN